MMLAEPLLLQIPATLLGFPPGSSTQWKLRLMLQLQPQVVFALPVRRGTSGELTLRIKKLQRAETANRMNGRMEAG